MSRNQVLLDLNSPEFQKQLFQLNKEEQRRVLLTLEKLYGMSWDQIYRDSGLKWEAILSRSGDRGKRLYSLRMGKRLRAVAIRDGDWMRFVSLHPDHDSAYGK
jgi:hypothetical protein